MAVLIDAETRVIVQGATGKQGSYHLLRMLEYGVKVVGGITPGKGGASIREVPVYDTVSEARSRTPIDASMILVPPAGALDAASEAIEAKIPLIVIVTEWVPVQDSMKIRGQAAEAGVRVIGPNTIGVISPGKSKVGVMPGSIYSPGSVGIVSRSGTLTHEMASNLTFRGIGQSSCVCIGGDPVKGTGFVDILRLFRNDDETQKIILIGEIGGMDEEMAADYLRENGYPKKIIAFIAGRCAPPDTRMGHAGAIVSKGLGTAESKIQKLTDAGVTVARTFEEILALV
jgi:succinyl-CoA synthetase alpha subunit